MCDPGFTSQGSHQHVLRLPRSMPSPFLYSGASLVLYGHSLGSALAIRSAAASCDAQHELLMVTNSSHSDAQEELVALSSAPDAIVLEGAFSSIGDVVAAYLPSLPSLPSTSLAVSLLEGSPLSAAGSLAFATLEHAPRLCVRGIFQVHGSLDLTVSVSVGRKLHAALPGRAWWTEVPWAGHDPLLHSGAQERLRQFFFEEVAPGGNAR